MKTHFMGSVSVMGAAALLVCVMSASSSAASSSGAVDQVTATVAALRMAGTITGGLMPSSDPGFVQMVSDIEGGDYFSAAMVAAKSNYAAEYLDRRIAKQMMSPLMSSTGVPDNDATTFIVANLIGSGTTANISKLWSDDHTYLINVNGTPTHAMSLSATQLASVNWLTDIVQVAGQTADQGDTGGNATGNSITIPASDVGGFMTLSDRGGDGSLAQYGLVNGTNLREIEALYEISMGLTLPELVVMQGASAEVAPRFVPEQDPSFFIGQGQPACLSCHGGGAATITHGYSTVANTFNYDPQMGIIYIPTQSTGGMKSYGSTPNNRNQVATCNLAKFATCNPASMGVLPNQGWDLSTWEAGGLLKEMGWTGPVTGNGLNSLGAAVGKAGLVYQYMVQRVIKEICPLGSISVQNQLSIASQAQSQDSFDYIVASVASDPSCR